MIDTNNLGRFLAAAVVLTITPGPAVLYLVTRSVSQGRAPESYRVLAWPVAG